MLHIAPVGFCMHYGRRMPNPKEGRTLFWRAFDSTGDVDFRVMKDRSEKRYLVEFRASLSRVEKDWPVYGVPGRETVRRTVDCLPAIELRDGSLIWHVVEGNFEPEMVLDENGRPICEFDACVDGWDPIDYDLIPDADRIALAQGITALHAKVQMGQESLSRYIECVSKVSIH